MEEGAGLEDGGGDGLGKGRRDLWVGQGRHLIEQVAGDVGWEVRVRVGIDLVESEGEERVVSRVWIHGFVGLGFDCGIEAEQNGFIREIRYTVKED